MSQRSHPLRAWPARRPRAAGFTLIEVLVAMTVGLAIMAALATMFAANSRQQQEHQSTAQQLESGRYVLDSLANDLRHAGFYGEFNPADLGPTYQDPDPCSLDPAAFGWNTAGAPIALPAALRGTSADTLACLENRLAGTEAITIRRVSTVEQTTASMAAGNLYVQVSRCPDDVQQLAAGTTVAAMALRNIACTGVVDSVRRYVSRTYFVARCNDCARGDGIPTLKRVEFIDGALRTTSIAEGIENLQLEYGLDTSATADGQADEFVAADEIDGTPAARAWPNVVAARIHLLSRNLEPSAGHQDARTYQLGRVTVTPATVSTATASYKRTLLTETVRLLNVGDRNDR